MRGRRRIVVLALLALAAPLPALAISDGALEPVDGPAAISVSTSLGSCGVIDDGVACEINVSFGSVPNADSYSATVTRADGSVIDYGAVAPGGTSLWVPYVGAGNYSVRVTAYGTPETPAEERDGRGDVIASGYDGAAEVDPAAGDTKPEAADAASDELELDTGAAGTSPADAGAGNTDAEGTPSTEVEPATESPADAPETAPAPECAAPAPAAPAPAAPVPPVEPPADLDPENPDEDADGIPDEQERITYEQQLAEYEAAIAAQAATPSC